MRKPRPSGLDQRFAPLRASLAADASGAVVAALVVGGVLVGLQGVTDRIALIGLGIAALTAAASSWITLRHRVPKGVPPALPDRARVERPPRVLRVRTLAFVGAALGLAELVRWAFGAQAAALPVDAVLGSAVGDAIVWARVTRWERRHGLELIGPTQAATVEEQRQLTFAREPQPAGRTPVLPRRAERDAFGRAPR